VPSLKKAIPEAYIWVLEDDFQGGKTKAVTGARDSWHCMNRRHRTGAAHVRRRANFRPACNRLTIFRKARCLPRGSAGQKSRGGQPRQGSARPPVIVPPAAVPPSGSVLVTEVVGRVGESHACRAYVVNVTRPVSPPWPGRCLRWLPSWLPPMVRNREGNPTGRVIALLHDAQLHEHAHATRRREQGPHGAPGAPPRQLRASARSPLRDRPAAEIRWPPDKLRLTASQEIT
jgi:hypothetical protein